MEAFQKIGQDPEYVSRFHAVKVFHAPSKCNCITSIVAQDTFWFSGRTRCVKNLERGSCRNRRTAYRMRIRDEFIPIEITAEDHRRFDEVRLVNCSSYLPMVSPPTNILREIGHLDMNDK